MMCSNWKCFQARNMPVEAAISAGRCNLIGKLVEVSWEIHLSMMDFALMMEFDKVKHWEVFEDHRRTVSFPAKFRS